MLGPCCWCYRFEDELTLKFGGGTQNREIGNEIEEIDRGDKSSSNASDIQKTYERKLAAHQGRGSEEKDGSKYLAVPGAGNYFILLRTLLNSLCGAGREDTDGKSGETCSEEENWDIEEGSQNNVLSSSMQLFLIIKRSLK